MRGQNLRIGIKANASATKKYIAAALSFNLDLQADTEESTTKDSTGGWKEYESTLKGWSGSGQANFVKDAEDTAAHQGLDLAAMLGETVVVDFDYTEGEKNRTLSAGMYTGNAIITAWKVSSQNGQKVTVDYSFQGTGKLNTAEAAADDEE